MDTVRLFVGFDQREAAAYHVFCQSVIDHSSVPVAFTPLASIDASAASVVQIPTQDREALHRSIEQLPLQPGSALGTGVLVALKQLAPDVKIDSAAILRGEMPQASSLKRIDFAR
mgnify:CR=1 FL=1